MTLFEDTLKLIEESYQRVIPRDLFNESMLLKSLGRLYIVAENGDLRGIQMDLEADDFGVDINDDGDLEAMNIEISYNGVSFRAYTPSNSRENYPLVFEHEYEYYSVFDNQGNPTEEVLAFLKTLE